MNYCRWLVASGCIALLLTSLTSCTKKEDISPIDIPGIPVEQDTEKLKKAVVLINYEDLGGHGTGFLIRGSKDVCTVVTARHVVKPSKKKPSKKLQLRTHDKKIWKTSNINSFLYHDLAFVTFEPEGKTCPYPTLDLGDSDQVKELDDILIIGFPKTHASAKVVYIVRGNVSAIVKPPLPKGYGISYQATTAGGMSGGPVVNTAGKVIAVHVATDTEIISMLQNNLPAEQQNLLDEVSERVNSVAVPNFKWGIPINIYLEHNRINTEVNKRVTENINQPTGDRNQQIDRTQSLDLSSNKIITSQDVENWYKRGRYFYEKEKWHEKAIAFFDKVIKIEPEHFSAWNSRGWALMELEDYGEALESFEKAIKIKPDYAYAWNGKGWALEKLEQYDEAIESYKKALEIAPKYKYPRQNLERLLDKLGRPIS